MTRASNFLLVGFERKKKERLTQRDRLPRACCLLRACLQMRMQMQMQEHKPSTRKEEKMIMRPREDMQRRKLEKRLI